MSVLRSWVGPAFARDGSGVAVVVHLVRDTDQFEHAVCDSEASVEDVGGQLIAAAAVVSAATGQWFELIGDFDARDGCHDYFGIKGTAGFLSFYCGLSAGAAREHVRVARALRELPLVAAAFSDGRLSYSKVRAATRAAGLIPERKLVKYACSLTAAQLERVLRQVVMITSGRLEAERDRRVSWRINGAGTVKISATLPADDGARVVAALECAKDRLDTAAIAAHDVPAGTPPIDTDAAERLPFTRADALVEVARTYLESGPADESGEDRDVVVVHVRTQELAGNVPAGTFSAPSHQPGQADIPLIGAVSAPTAAKMACTARVQLLIEGADGHVLHLGRTQRFVTKMQRRALMARDGCCQWPGCARARHLKAHHVIHWARDGRSDLDNYVLLCARHHTLVHEGEITISKLPPSIEATYLAGDRWQFRRATGAVIHSQHTDAAGGAREEEPWDRETRILASLINDVHDIEHPIAKQIRPNWGGEPMNISHVLDMLLSDITLHEDITTHAS